MQALTENEIVRKSLSNTDDGTHLAPMLVSPREYVSAGFAVFLGRSHDVVNLLSGKFLNSTATGLPIFEIDSVLAHQLLALLFVVYRSCEHGSD